MRLIRQCNEDHLKIQTLSISRRYSNPPLLTGMELKFLISLFSTLFFVFFHRQRRTCWLMVNLMIMMMMKRMKT